MFCATKLLKYIHGMHRKQLVRYFCITVVLGPNELHVEEYCEYLAASTRRLLKCYEYFCFLLHNILFNSSNGYGRFNTITSTYAALSRPPAYYSNGHIRSLHLCKVVCVYARVTDNMPLNRRAKCLWKYLFS
jgi:hypothetical protein